MGECFCFVLVFSGKLTYFRGSELAQQLSSGWKSCSRRKVRWKFSSLTRVRDPKAAPKPATKRRRVEVSEELQECSKSSKKAKKAKKSKSSRRQVSCFFFFFFFFFFFWLVANNNQQTNLQEVEPCLQKLSQHVMNGPEEEEVNIEKLKELAVKSLSELYQENCITVNFNGFLL